MKTSQEHRPPSWLYPEARDLWRAVSKQLWAREYRPTPLERVAGALLAEELAIVQNESADNEQRSCSLARARTLQVVLKMEPVEQRRRKA